MVRYDLVIVGGGPAGLSLACLAGGLGLRIAVVDRQCLDQLSSPVGDGRDIALTHHSVQILERAGAWSTIAAGDIAPIRRACIKNADESHVLSFNSDRTGREALGYLVSNQILRTALYRAARNAGNVELITGDAVKGLDLGGPLAGISLTSGKSLTASLVAAADSRFSEMRRKAGIGADIRDFGHVCIVCRLKHEKPHDGTAYEWFDTDQTLAILPLNNRESSIVITQRATSAARTMELQPEAFAADVERRFAGRWGRMELCGERHAYPLAAVYADRFFANRFALIGDAAVGMHPVTAHGFNFGLKGAETLAGKISSAIKSGLDIGSATVLESYDHEHRRSTFPLYVATNALVRLYTADSIPARIARSGILRIGDRLSPIKDFMLRRLTEIDERRPLT